MTVSVKFSTSLAAATGSFSRSKDITITPVIQEGDTKVIDGSTGLRENNSHQQASDALIGTVIN